MHLKRQTSYSYSDPSYVSNLKVHRNKGNIIRAQELNTQNPIKWSSESWRRSITQSEVYYCDGCWIKSHKQGYSYFLLLHCHYVPFHHFTACCQKCSQRDLESWQPPFVRQLYCGWGLPCKLVFFSPYEVKCTMEMGSSVSPSFEFSSVFLLSTCILIAPHASSSREGNEGLHCSVQLQ